MSFFSRPSRRSLIPFPGTEIYERYKDEYGFAEWWLGDERNFDAPQCGRHAFYQVLMYRMGVVLDADFFRYPPETTGSDPPRVPLHVRQQFPEAEPPAAPALLSMIDLSRKLAAVSPALERAVFKAPSLLRKTLLRRRGYL